MAHIKSFQILCLDEVLPDWLHLLIEESIMYDAELLYWYHTHQLCEREARNSVVVYIELCDSSVLDDLHKLLGTNIFDVVILQLQFLNRWALLDQITD